MQELNMIFMMDKKKVTLAGLELSNNLTVRIYCIATLLMDMSLCMYFVVISAKAFNEFSRFVLLAQLQNKSYICCKLSIFSNSYNLRYFQSVHTP